LASSEEVTYTYDSLQRLIGAVTTDSPTVPQWGQAFTYDGFGNRTSASVTKGSAPYGNWAYDAATNRASDFYDANGNMTFAPSGYPGYTYDVENRLVSVPASNQDGSGYELYAYAPRNK
jgi:YD repeat-containing protein